MNKNKGIRPEEYKKMLFKINAPFKKALEAIVKAKPRKLEPEE